MQFAFSRILNDHNLWENLPAVGSEVLTKLIHLSHSSRLPTSSLSTAAGLGGLPGGEIQMLSLVGCDWLM